jgi:class 3 adenylate cyclase
MAASWLIAAFQTDLTVCCKTPRRRKRPNLEEGVTGGFWVNSARKLGAGSTMTATRRLIAMLAADVVGYSRLMSADEEGTHEG